MLLEALGPEVLEALERTGALLGGWLQIITFVPAASCTPNFTPGHLSPNSPNPDTSRTPNRAH